MSGGFAWTLPCAACRVQPAWPLKSGTGRTAKVTDPTEARPAGTVPPSATLKLMFRYATPLNAPSLGSSSVPLRAQPQRSPQATCGHCAGAAACAHTTSCPHGAACRAPQRVLADVEHGQIPGGPERAGKGALRAHWRPQPTDHRVHVQNPYMERATCSLLTLRSAYASGQAARLWLLLHAPGSAPREQLCASRLTSPPGTSGSALQSRPGRWCGWRAKLPHHEAHCVPWGLHLRCT